MVPCVLVLMNIRVVAAWVAWNLWLALIPVACAYAIRWMAPLARRRAPLKLVVAVLVLVWVAFLPNASYLLTEWRHFLGMVAGSDLFYRAREDSAAAVLFVWYTVFYFVYSALGMLAFALSIRPLAAMLRERGRSLVVPAVLLFILVSVGVYLGLILRFNSWDLVTRPHVVWAAMVDIVRRPHLAAFILFFSGVLWAFYQMTDMWVEGFLLKMRALSGPRVPSR